MCERLPDPTTLVFENGKFLPTETVSKDDLRQLARLMAPRAAGDRLVAMSLAKDGKRVWVEVGHRCGALCGDGHLFALDKIDGEWRATCFAVWSS